LIKKLLPENKTLSYFYPQLKFILEKGCLSRRILRKIENSRDNKERNVIQKVQNNTKAFDISSNMDMSSASPFLKRKAFSTNKITANEIIETYSLLSDCLKNDRMFQ